MDNILQLLPIGVVTLSVLTLTIITLILAGIYQVGILTLKLLLNADHENAPDFNWDNKIWLRLHNLAFIKKKGNLVGKTKCGKYFVRTHIGSSTARPQVGFSGSYSINSSSFYEFNTTNNYKAIKGYDKVVEALVPREAKGYLLTLASLGLLDLTIVTMQHYFFPVVILISIALIVFGVRTLAGKVYTNSSKITNHKERIESLETKGDK